MTGSPSLAVEIFTHFAEAIAAGTGTPFIAWDVLTRTAGTVVVMNPIVRWLGCFVHGVECRDFWHNCLLGVLVQEVL